MQPAWSPLGRRIAYWGLRGRGGQRDLWTVAADGSETKTGGTEVTDDAALDWSPAWSPDGRHLHFSSTRGGTMNLWRGRIDETTGRVLGAPEPLTTPSLWSGNSGFARDGRHAVFASLDWRSTLLRAPFDAARGQLAGPPTAVLRSTQPIRDHDLSPDGESVALTSASAVEDLLVARLDGSPYRRLTDDAYRDRGASWRPDGQSIAFYSDRGGSYEVWTIRPDGSGLERVVAARDGSRNFPVWSPDGSRLAVSSVPGNWSLLRLGPGAAAEAEEEMPAPEGRASGRSRGRPTGRGSRASSSARTRPSTASASSRSRRAATRRGAKRGGSIGSRRGGSATVAGSSSAALAASRSSTRRRGGKSRWSRWAATSSARRCASRATSVSSPGPRPPPRATSGW
jgi:hypothetical protein